MPVEHLLTMYLNQDLFVSLSTTGSYHGRTVHACTITLEYKLRCDGIPSWSSSSAWTSSKTMECLCLHTMMSSPSTSDVEKMESEGLWPDFREDVTRSLKWKS